MKGGGRGGCGGGGGGVRLWDQEQSEKEWPPTDLDVLWAKVCASLGFVRLLKFHGDMHVLLDVTRDACHAWVVGGAHVHVLLDVARDACHAWVVGGAHTP